MDMNAVNQNAGRQLAFNPENCERMPSGIFCSDSFGRWALTDVSGMPLLAAESFPQDLLPYMASSGSFYGPSLHILVVTLACNHACIYCRVAPVSEKEKGTEMTLETAKKSIDLAFNTPNDCITFEFQGGEALLNWPVVKSSVIYAKEKNKIYKKDMRMAIVTNLSLMDEEKFKFFVNEGVSVCTSLDGPAALHNLNRRYGNSGGHDKAVYWIKRFAAAASSSGKPDSLPSALMTTTKHSLSIPEKIVDEYRDLGLGGIFIRPLSPIGHAGTVWKDIGYDPLEYKLFYARSLKRVLEINRCGERFVERNAALFARKLFHFENPNYLDLKSPCGAVTGQLAYNWDGNVYSCDEGRMLGAGGDASFMLGSVYATKWRELFVKPSAIMCASASCLESQPACARCAFKPFCGVCPVHNKAAQGCIYGNMKGSYWCEIQKAVFYVVLAALRNPADREIIKGWID